MTKVVFAPDSFKGSIGATSVASALAAGWRDVRPRDEVVLRPMADGGEGTLDAFEAAVTGAERRPVLVDGPDGASVNASWLLLPATSDTPDGTAVVELASTSGLELLGDRRLGLDAHTRGFGQAIAAALNHGVSRLVLGIGSSSSTDGGVGLLATLGGRFIDAAGNLVVPGARGLGTIASIDLSGLLPLPRGGVVVLTDVTSPLTGPRGAAVVFGPQKGLEADAIRRADEDLERLAGLLPADPDTRGAGAAGGTGFGLLAWGAKLVPGAVEVAKLLGVADAIAGADLVVTGEGSYDAQSAAGKAPAHVAALAHAAQVPVALVAGRIPDGADLASFAYAFSLTEMAKSAASAMLEPKRWLSEAGARLARTV